MMTLILAGIMLKPEAVFSRVGYTFQKRQADLTRIGNVYLDSSSSARVVSWADSLKTWKKNPFLGRGVTGAGFIDGQYILFLSELGILGFLAFLWLLWIILKQSLNVLRITKDELYKGVTLGFITGFIGLTIHAVTANTFILIRIMEPFWFIAGIIMMVPTLLEAEDKIDR